MDYVKGESLSDAVWARWRDLRREDRLNILTHVDATDPAFHKDPSAVVRGLIHMKDCLAFKNATGVTLSLPKITKESLKQTDRAEVQCYDAKRGLYLLVKPDILPDRLFQSKVAGVLRSLPVDVVRQMLESFREDDMSVLEDAILNVGGYLRLKISVLATPRARFWDRYGTQAAHPTVTVYLPEPQVRQQIRAGNEDASCAARRSACVLRSPASGGST